MPVRAAPDIPVYTYFLPFGTPNSAPIFYQATQAQLDTQFSIAWEQIIKNGGNLTAEQQQLMLQNLRFVYKHICQTGVRRDDKYHFFVQSGVPRPPMASKIPTVNQTPTTTQPSPAAVSSSGPNHQLPSSQIAIPHSSAVNDAAGPMTGGPAHEGPSPNQRPSLEPVPNQAVQQITNQTPSSNYKPVDAQLASIPTSSATNRLSAPASSSISQEAIPVVESLPASLQAGPFTPNQAMSFVDILRQNNPSAQDLADSIIRELGSPRKNTRKRKFAPESDVETGQSSSEKGRQKSRLDGDPRQATGNPSASPRKDGSSMGDKSAPMASPPKSQPPPLVLTLTPGREVLPSDSTLPMVPAPLAETLPGNLPVPTQVPGPVSTEPLADSSTSLHQTTANLNAPTDVSASESLRSSLAPRATSQNFAPLNPSQESDEQRPQPNQPESHPPAQSVALTAQSTPSRPPSTKNTPNIIPPTPTQPPTPAKQPDFKQLIPPEGHPFLPSPGRTRIITPPPIIAILPASDDTHFSPSLEPASRGGDSEVDELMDDADENPKVVDVVAPVTAPTIPADAPLATNDQAVEIAETTAMLPRVRVRPKTEFWVEIPYRPDLLKKARKGPPSGLRPETISSSRTTSRSVSLSAEARASRTPSRAGSQLNVLSDKDILSDYHARQIFVPCRWKGCKIVVDSLEKLRLHITATHVPKDEQRSFDCQWRGCPAKPFETRKSLSQHVKGHISKLYPCPLENCTALLDSETSLLKHVHNTHRSNGHLCPIALPTQLVPPAELPTLPTGPIPVYHEYKGLVRPAVISKAKREKLSPEVLHKILGHGIAQGLPRNAPLRRLLRESLTLESASAFDEYEFLRKEDDKDLRSMLDLVDLRALKEERRRTVLGHSHPSGPNSSKPPSSRASGQRSPLLPLNRLEVQDGAETKVVERSRRSSTQSSEKGSVLDPIVLDDLDD
ncbi:hypothetical protein M407DRAFT_6163 [Tulasnella calospora MUT 4182]|uniref:C2H2-type domain-containing protein n=1 Tax=Tulasnella calospora MUT 4182 TaxID=1051891 RepID=A0A0C3QEC2_9AGAM|nr:hypothetical protein M407DRAFT_6163 [Tulasnella calospora MUT 4182]